MRSAGDRVLLGGLALSAAGMAPFLLADGVPSLLVARFLSGLSAGLLSGTATAALIDLTPPARRARATLVSTIAQMADSASVPSSPASWQPGLSRRCAHH